MPCPKISSLPMAFPSMKSLNFCIWKKKNNNNNMNPSNLWHYLLIFSKHDLFCLRRFWLSADGFGELGVLVSFRWRLLLRIICRIPCGNIHGQTQPAKKGDNRRPLFCYSSAGQSPKKENTRASVPVWSLRLRQALGLFKPTQGSTRYVRTNKRNLYRSLGFGMSLILIFKGHHTVIHSKFCRCHVEKFQVFTFLYHVSIIYTPNIYLVQRRDSNTNKFFSLL